MLKFGEGRVQYCAEPRKITAWDFHMIMNSVKSNSKFSSGNKEAIKSSSESLIRLTHSKSVMIPICRVTSWRQVC